MRLLEFHEQIPCANQLAQCVVLHPCNRKRQSSSQSIITASRQQPVDAAFNAIKESAP